MQDRDPLTTSTISPLQNLWEREYESTDTPFDIEEPDEWIATLAKSRRIRGQVLDAGCGPGRNSIYLAETGCNVLGVDISTKAISRAQRNAAEKSSRAQFLQANLCEISGYEDRFDSVVDIGCFHSLDQCDRAAYAAALHRVCREGAVIFLRAFRWNHPSGSSADALTAEDIRSAFSNNGWSERELVEREIELRISPTEKPRTSCWFAEMHYQPLPVEIDPQRVPKCRS